MGGDHGARPPATRSPYQMRGKPPVRAVPLACPRTAYRRLMEDDMATTTAELPRWDLETVFPGVRSPELDAAVAEVQADIETLGRRYEELGIDGDARPSADEAATAFDELADRLNAIVDRFSTIAAYVTCLVTADSRDSEAQARQSELRLLGVTLDKLSTRLTAWIGA